LANVIIKVEKFLDTRPFKNGPVETFERILMRDARQDTVADSEGHVGAQAALWLLGSVASFCRRPFDAELVLKHFSPPFDLPSLIEALEAIGLKAGLVVWPEADLAALPLPAVAFIAEPARVGAGAPADPVSPHTSLLMPALIVKHVGPPLAWVRPGGSEPEAVALDAARAQYAPLLLLVAKAEPALADSDGSSAPKKPFGLSWFIPELLRHKNLWRDILLASLAIQLAGLGTPLFTQVNKVTMVFITHQVPRGLQVDEVVNMGQHATQMSLVKDVT
jgi:subfamily B ATP-binding cassette protein HlyB/CyaB